MTIVCIWLFLLSSLWKTITCNSTFYIDTDILSRASFLEVLLIDYNNQVPPNYELDKPCEVAVHLSINNFDSVNEATMDFTMGLIIHQTWLDTRLDFVGLIDDDLLELDNRLMNKVWVPDLFIANEKRATVHDITVPNRMMHLYQDGRITYKSRISLTAQCQMDLQRYPLDTQVCSLIIRSFSYTTRNLIFVWDSRGVSTDPEVILPQFRLSHHNISHCKDNDNANFTCLQVDFHLSRMVGFCLLQIYIPTTLIVLLSWISFWLSCDAVPARTSLGILTVLTMTTQSSAAVSTLPRVSYIKALDVWIAICLAFVFASMIEFAIVNVLARRAICENVFRSVNNGQDSKSVNHCSVCCTQSTAMVPVYYLDPYGKEKASTVDRISRIGFPVVFSIFSIVYWTVYTN